MQAAQHLVEVGQAGGEARQAAVAAVGLGRHVHRARPGRRRRSDEAAGGAAGLGQGVELLLGRLDLVAGGESRVALGGGDGDLAADADQVAAQRQVVDHPAIVGRVGGRAARGRRGRRGSAGRPAPRTPGSRWNCSAIRIGSASWPLADVLLDRLEQAPWNGSKKWRPRRARRSAARRRRCRRAGCRAAPVPPRDWPARGRPPPPPTERRADQLGERGP